MSEKTVKLTGVRKLIGMNMKKSADEIPMGYSTIKVDVTDMLRLKSELREKNVKVSDSVFFMFASAAAMQKYPQFNARSNGVDEATYYDTINPGIAVDGEKGLIVLVLHDIGGKSLLELAELFHELMGRFKSGHMKPEDFSGSAFTISNLSKTENFSIGPIVTNNECFILGIGGIHKEATVLADGSIAARDICTITMTNNHILVDGADCTRFLTEMKHVLEDPQTLLPDAE